MTVIESRQIAQNVFYREYLGKSGEVKPVNSNDAQYKLADNSLFIETDTGQPYTFDATQNTWRSFGGE